MELLLYLSRPCVWRSHDLSIPPSASADRPYGARGVRNDRDEPECEGHGSIEPDRCGGTVCNIRIFRRFSDFADANSRICSSEGGSEGVFSVQHKWRKLNRRHLASSAGVLRLQRSGRQYWLETTPLPVVYLVEHPDRSVAEASAKRRFARSSETFPVLARIRYQL